ncbi:MAG: hypothetical protein HY897_13170 [Deltaproteobacteria bacterium]|nr:hypothetical protein [Deltaproteobacteria bacterium]
MTPEEGAVLTAKLAAARKLPASKTVALHALVGAFLGYAVVHPAAMAIDVLSGGESGHVAHALAGSFTSSHLGMAAYFAVLGAVLGAVHAFYAQAIQNRNQLVDGLEVLLPICVWCRKIRPPDADPKVPKNWKPIESYIAEKTGVLLSHGICPECSGKLYPEGRRVSCRYGFGVDCAGVEDGAGNDLEERDSALIALEDGVNAKKGGVP